MYFDTNDLDRAIADYDLATQINPNRAKAYANRARAHEKKVDRERAIADFRKAYSLGDTQSADDLRRLGVTP